MSRILLTWELGLNLGHLTRLLPLAERLKAEGHSVLVATRDIQAAIGVLAPAGIPFIPAPHLPKGIALDHRPAGYADVHGSPRFDAVRYERTIDLVTVQEPRIVGVVKGEAMGPPAWSPDGTRIALAGNLFIDIFAARSGQPLVHERLEKSGSMHVRYTPDGRYFIESDLNGSGTGLGVKIWDGSRQKLLQQIPGDIGNISISKDGKHLALGGINHTTVWELK
jgi:hypothetical protein